MAGSSRKTPPKTKPTRQATAYAAAQRRAGARAARREDCRTCGADVLRGLDAKVLALEAVVDPVPVNAVQEVLAWAAGRASYLASRWESRVELDRRDLHHLRAAPGSGAGVTVYLEHVCHAVPDGPTQAELDLQEVTRWKTEADAPPPF